MFYVYVYVDPITNQPFYVGKGSGDRKYHHLWNWKKHKNDLIKASIQQLHEQGQRPIIQEVFHAENEHDAFVEETRLIREYGRLDLGTGILCNKTFGGEGFGNTGTKWSEVQRAKIQHRNLEVPRGRGVIQYTMTGQYIQTFNSPRDLRDAGFSNTQIMRIRICCNSQTFSAAGYRWSFIGSQLKELSKGKQVNQIDPTTKHVVNTFVSIGAASKQTGVHPNSISACVRGKLCTAGGFIWKSNEDKEPKLNTRNKPVQQLNEVGEVVRTFTSVLAAAKTLGIDSTNISNVCKGKRITAGGYRWKYV